MDLCELEESSLILGLLLGDSEDGPSCQMPSSATSDTVDRDKELPGASIR